MAKDRFLGQFLHEYLRTPIPVVFLLARFGQPFGIDLLEAAFDEPVHGARGEHEYRLDAECLCAMFDSLQNSIAVALALNLRRYRQCRQFRGAGFRIGIQRRATENDSVVLDDGIGGDIAFDFRAAALDERAVTFEWLDQLQDSPDIVGRGLAQALEFLVDDHGADAVVREDFHQQRAVDRERQDVRSLDAALAGLDAVLQVERDIERAGGRRQARGQAPGPRPRG